MWSTDDSLSDALQHSPANRKQQLRHVQKIIHAKMTILRRCMAIDGLFYKVWRSSGGICISPIIIALIFAMGNPVSN